MLELIKPDREAPVGTNLTPEQEAVLRRVRKTALAQAALAMIDRADAKDIAQKTMLEIWKESTSEPRLWSDEAERDALQYRITANAIVDLRRHGEAMRRHEPDEEVDLDLLPSPSSSQQDRLERKEFLASVGRALSTLTTRAREIWSWRYLDDLTPAEIVPLAEINVEGIYSQLHKANKALRPAMRAEGYDNASESE